MPHALAWVTRRLSSIIRSGVRATSMPPLSVKTPSSWYCSVESLVSSNIIFEYSMGKTKLDACPVEPPGFGSGPLSTSTRSFQPSSARWCTRLLPTMPAPMMTALAVVGASLTSFLHQRPGGSGGVPRGNTALQQLRKGGFQAAQASVDLRQGQAEQRGDPRGLGLQLGGGLLREPG